MKKKLDIKKLVLLNLPYVFAFYFVDKLAAVFRLAPGTEFIDKLTGGFANFGAAFANPLPSFHPVDLLIGVAGGALLKLAVYIKGKNRKKFRQGEEYGSARWGRPEDIRPYMDDDFSNNVILTQTEGLTMNSRPKQPKYARNKNILVIGGSGSGKTRFFVKPNLMQMHSSYVVTDPKGTILVECGKMLQRGTPKLGKDGKPFIMYKFRSMCKDAERDGPRWADADDARCTRFGAFLRRTRLDELPPRCDDGEAVADTDAKSNQKLVDGHAVSYVLEVG